MLMILKLAHWMDISAWIPYRQLWTLGKTEFFTSSVNLFFFLCALTQSMLLTIIHPVSQARKLGIISSTILSLASHSQLIAEPTLPPTHLSDWTTSLHFHHHYFSSGPFLFLFSMIETASCPPENSLSFCWWSQTPVFLTGHMASKNKNYISQLSL